jgi:hypothetical protein
MVIMLLFENLKIIMKTLKSGMFITSHHFIILNQAATMSLLPQLRVSLAK